jgi:hypothetical protein
MAICKGGIARFITAIDRCSPCEADKDLVMHIELPIAGGHILMEQMHRINGLLVNKGNNVHINIEPDSKAETIRLFDALADEESLLPLQDMFWGAYLEAVLTSLEYNGCLALKKANKAANYSTLKYIFILGPGLPTPAFYSIT